MTLQPSFKTSRIALKGILHLSHGGHPSTLFFGSRVSVGRDASADGGGLAGGETVYVRQTREITVEDGGGRTDQESPQRPS